jgi:uncharacterized membrane protein
MTKPRQQLLSARRRLIIALAIGGFAGIICIFLGEWKLAPLMIWSVAAASYMTITWKKIWSMTGSQTAELAVSEDPTRGITELILTIASLASLIAVGFVISQASKQDGLKELLLVGIGVVSVIISWAVTHTIYTLRYARLYYAGKDGGIDFNEDGPSYTDFAYLSFTIGMTYQVSDTNIKASEIRKTALKHALLSYLFGTVIVATTINLVAGLAK